MKKLALFLYAAGLFACTSGRNYSQAVVALVDVSGTYADQKADVVNVIKRGILPKLMPGDSLYVIRIDGESYKKDNVEADLNLDVRPSRANAQKLAFASKLEGFAHRPMHASHTDIRGAMMLGAEYLKESGAALARSSSSATWRRTCRRASSAIWPRTSSPGGASSP